MTTIRPEPLALDPTKLIGDVKEQWVERDDILAANVGLFCPVCLMPLETELKDTDTNKVDMSFACETHSIMISIGQFATGARICYQCHRA